MRKEDQREREREREGWGGGGGGRGKWGREERECTFIGDELEKNSRNCENFTLPSAWFELSPFSSMIWEPFQQVFLTCLCEI